MSKSMIKIIILVTVLVAIIALITTVAIMNVNLGPLKILAIKDIAQSKTSIEKANKNLTDENSKYSSKSSELEAAKNEYKSEKTKYEAISEETISIIQDATKDEKYFIEYLWITLGGYAKSHSLALTVIDPGSKVTSDQTSTAADKTADATKVAEKSALVTTIEASNAEATPAAGTTPTAAGTTPTAAGTTPTVTAKDKVITIQLKGNYLNVADFVFEVENDKTLRFKLDNISMKSSGGTDVIASFEVKNLVIIK